MGAYRFMLSRRWLTFAVVVVMLAYVAWWLGEWQFGRLHDRKASNAIVRTNENLPTAPVGEVLAPGNEVGKRDEWRHVEATGTYDVAKTIIVRYRNDDDGAPGVDVVVPLVTTSGPTVVVDRGFLQTDARSLDDLDVPPAPSGQVTILGWVRVDGTGPSTQVDSDLSTRAISSNEIGPAIGQTVYDGFVDAISEDGQDIPGLTPRTLPELDNGPHFFYGLQWWFFGLLAVFGYFYLAYDERVRGPRGEREPHPSRAAAAAPAPKAERPKKVRQTNVPQEYQRRPAKR